MEEVKPFPPKATQLAPTLHHLYQGQVRSTTPIIMSQMFDDSKTPSTSWIKITKTNMK